jgi:hypothetical protein
VSRRPHPPLRGPALEAARASPGKTQAAGAPRADLLGPPRELLIDTREELIIALSEASELEHGLLVQYLFAAYSLKKRPSEGLSEAQVERVRDWERAVLEVARQEMAHLGTVCNMLTAVGGAPTLGRPNFPQGRQGAFARLGESYYPFDFQLERFRESSLRRFIAFEAPAEARLPEERLVAPDPLRYDRLGELYRQIAEGFRRLDDLYRARGERLFIGPPEAQDRTRWSAGLNLIPVTDAASAVRAVESIVIEGEGSPEEREGSHYQTFRRILEEYREEVRADPAFEPARAVATTPLTRRHRDSGEGPQALLEEGSPAQGLSELFNSAYTTVLLMLAQFYDFGGETPAQRAALQAAIRQSMSAIIRPLAEVLTELPARQDGEERAGPGFELYTELRVPSQLESRFILLRERLELAAAECRRLAELGPQPLRRLAFIARNLELLTQNLERAREGSP